MKIGESYRLKTMAKYAQGKVLDIGYNNQPNPFIQNADGLDMTVEAKPPHYQNFYLLPESLIYPMEDNSYDTVLAWEVIEHVLNLEIFFQEIGRVLKKKWTLVISTPNPLFYSYHIMTIFNLFYKNWIRWDHVHLFCNGDIQTLANIFGYELQEIKAAYWQFLNFQIPLPWNWLKFLSFQNIYILKKIM